MIIYDASGVVLLDIEVDDTSLRYKAIKGENSLTLKFSLSEFIEFPLGSWCEFKGEVYLLMASSDITMSHRRNFEFSLVMYSEDAKSKRYKFRNPVDGRLKFPLTAFPKEHLQMFVDNMNMREPAGNKTWKVGTCIEHERVTLSYSHTTCHDALVQLADHLELDYWFDGRVVNIGKLEVNKEAPFTLSYGGDGEGLKSGIKRKNYSDALPIEVLYVEGSEENIDFSKYGSNELHMPKSQTIGYDGIHFSDENGFDPQSARWYVTDENGLSLRRSDKEQTTFAEDSLDCSEITPTKEEMVEQIHVADEEKHFYDIYFSSDVDYKEYQIAGEVAYIVFQTGMLAGRKFDLATNNKGTIICEKIGSDSATPSWKVELKPEEIDGMILPDHRIGYGPYDGDKFKVFGVQLPAEYISNNTTKSGAEWDMFRYAVKHMYANEDPQYTISGELDEIYAKRNWSWLKDKIVLGGYVSFSDKSFQEDPLLIRITGIKEYVNKPYSPQLELSNQNIGGTLVGTLNRIENQEVYNEVLYRESVNFSKRRYRDAQETISMLENAMLDGYTESIKPVAIDTYMMLVGNESTQFRFVDSKTKPTKVESTLAYSDLTKKVTWDKCIVQHMTLGINEISSRYSGVQYKFWDVPGDEAQATDADKGYYLYLRASQTTQEANFVLSDSPIGMTDEIGWYHFLTAILNKEVDGIRSFVSVYGFTEILPGQISTDIIRSADGNTYFDLAKGRIAGAIEFLAGTKGIENIEGLSDAIQNSVGGLEFGKYNLLRNSGFTGDFVTESLDDTTFLDEDDEMFSDPFTHWTASNASVQNSEVGQSGKEVVLSNGTLSQTLKDKIIAGENYVLSFRAKGQSLSYSIGGVSGTETLSAEWQKYIIKFKPESAASVFSINATATICDLQLERGTVQSAWGHSMYDNQSEIAMYQAIDYLKSAIKDGSSTVLGGLILSNLIMLGNPGRQDNTAGVSGIYNNDDDVAFWGGGTWVQAIATAMRYAEDPYYTPTDDELATLAKYVVTHGGKAILTDAIIRGMIIAKSGKISGFNIEDDWLRAAGEGYETTVSPARISTRATSKELPNGTFTSLANMQAYPGAGISSIIHAKVEMTPSRDFPEERAIAVYASAKGANKAKYDPTVLGDYLGEYGGNYAFYSPDGMFAGLRPKCVVLSDGQTYRCSHVDHTLISNSEVGITNKIYLPEDPQDGQVIKIWKNNTHILVIATTDGRNIVRMNIGTQASWGIDSAFFGTIDLIYHSTLGAWLMIIHETY